MRHVRCAYEQVAKSRYQPSKGVASANKSTRSKEAFKTNSYLVMRQKLNDTQARFCGKTAFVSAKQQP